MKICISDMLDGVRDDSVALREQDIVASEQIKEATMRKIHENDTQAAPRRRIGRGARMAILAAAILLALSVTALAAGRVWRSVNFDGEEVGTLEPEATIPPDEEVIELNSEAQYEEAAAILAQQSADELIIIRWDDGSCESTGRRKDIDSVEELTEQLKEESSELSIPFAIPEGFRLESGAIYYQAAEGNAYALMSSEEHDGFTVERYAVPEEGNFISGYMLDFEDEAGTELHIFANMEDEGEWSFQAEEGGRVEPFEAEGMEKALLIGSEDHASAYLLQVFEEPIPYTSTFLLMDEEANFPTEYIEAVYQAYLTSPDADRLMEMVAP